MSASVRRRGETSGHRSLRVTVTERLVNRGVDIDTIDLGLLPAGRRPVGRHGRLHLRRREPARVLHLRPARPVLGRGQRRGPLAARRAADRPAAGPEAPADAAASDEDTEPTVDLSDELALVRATRTEPSGDPRRRRGRRADRRGPAAAPSGGRPAAAARRRRLQRGLRPGLLRAERRERGTGDGAVGGWEPAIVVNYPVEPSLQVDSEPAGRGRPAVRRSCRPRYPAPTSSPPRSRRRRRARARAAGRADRARPGPAVQPPQAGHGAELGRDHVRRAQALTLSRWRPDAGDPGSSRSTSPGRSPRSDRPTPGRAGPAPR